MKRIERDVRVRSRSKGFPVCSSGVSTGVAVAKIDSGSLMMGGLKPGSFGVRYASSSPPDPASESESFLARPSSALELDRRSCFLPILPNNRWRREGLGLLRPSLAGSI